MAGGANKRKKQAKKYNLQKPNKPKMVMSEYLILSRALASGTQQISTEMTSMR